MSQQPAPENSTPSTALTTGKTKVLDLDYNVAVVLCYLPVCAINLIFSLVWLNSEPKENTFLRFHSLQSLVLCGGAIVAAIGFTIINGILAAIPLIGWLLALVGSGICSIIGIGFLVISIIASINAYQGKMYRIRYICDIADKYMK